MNINTTSTYTYGSSASKGLSGLASGMDTESLVKEMLSGTQSKIDAQEALKQQTEWKQEIYRDLITQINTFQTDYFSASSSKSLTSQALYNAMNAATESKNFKISASTGTPIGTTSLEVHQLASHYSISSGQAVSGRLAGAMQVSDLQSLVDGQLNGKKNLVFSVTPSDGQTKTVSIDLKDFFVQDGRFVENVDADAIAAEIQKQLKSQGGLDAKVSMAGGQLSIETKDADSRLSVEGSSSKQALSLLGLTATSEAKADRYNTKRTLTGKLNLTPALKFSMTLDDGLQKEISLDVRKLTDADGKVDLAAVRSTLSAEIDRQFGKGVVRVSGTADQLELSATVNGRKLTLNKGDDASVLTALGFKNGQSNRIAAYNTLGELQVSTPLQGNRFRFEINGAQFSFSEDDDIDQVLSTINSSTAGVAVVYKPLEDAFVMTANDAGAGRGITMSQTEGNLLNVLFGAADGSLKTGNTAASVAYTNGTIVGAGDVQLSGVKSGSLGLIVNGKYHSIDVSAQADATKDYDLETLLEKLNRELATQFGTTGEVDDEGNEISNIELVAAKDAEGKPAGPITLTVRNGASVQMYGLRAGTEPADAAKDGNLAAALGLVTEDKAVNNIVDEKMTLKAAGLEELAGQLNAANSGSAIDPETATLADLKALTQGGKIEVSFEEGRFIVTSNDPEAYGNFTFGSAQQNELLFGTKTLALGTAAGKRAVIEEGKNAIVRIDGMMTERNSNVFTYNGMTVELTGVSKPVGDGEAMTGSVQVLDENGNLVKPSSLEGAYADGRWIDSEGYLRRGTKQKDGTFVYSAQDKYVTMMTGALTDEPGENTRHYDGVVIRDASGNRVSGMGITFDNKLIDGSGNPVQARETETVTVTRDTDKLVDNIKGFIDEYNKLVKTISEYLNEDANYRDYAPLTEEQRGEMSEKQIELWEEKAKEGLLRRDSILSDFLQKMRTIWYETNSSGYAIYELGIETGDWSTRGQLTFSSDGETQLRHMLASDPTGVMNFFANTVDGAAVRVNDVIREVANTSSGSPGTLVQLAGIKGKASEKNNTLYDKIESINERIERLKDQYESEKNRYWDQFNTMEQLIANMSSQSAWLSQQFTY